MWCISHSTCPLCRTKVQPGQGFAAAVEISEDVGFHSIEGGTSSDAVEVYASCICAKYVGNERSRFISPTDFLNPYLLRALLEKAEEEYAFDHQIGLSIPCDEDVFQSLTYLLQKNDSSLENSGVGELIPRKTILSDGKSCRR
ncbi:hypothetical protein SUGI_0386330 [Cryptomeria japonica]|nr:hypothetical protein SUGI_0386330 [Cryptomeria japonica]